MTQHEVISILVVAAITLLLVLVWLNDRRMRRKSSTPLSGMLTSFDQVFHPEAAQATEIREIQRELPADTSVPGDPLRSTPATGERSALGNRPVRSDPLLLPA